MYVKRKHEMVKKRNRSNFLQYEICHVALTLEKMLGENDWAKLSPAQFLFQSPKLHNFSLTSKLTYNKHILLLFDCDCGPHKKEKERNFLDFDLPY